MKKISDFKYKVLKKESATLRKIVRNGLGAYNKSKAGAYRWAPLNVEVRGKGRKVLGGLIGGTSWGWCYIDLLWINDKSRLRGLGSGLLGLAEGEAKVRGCRNVFLNTFSFQAPGFYEKLGYRAFGRLDNFPKGHERIYYRKKLGAQK